MPSRIEQYAVIGDTQTAALVADDGSLDWLCAPRFDSPACFAALLGAPEHGRWLVAPKAGGRAARRRYRDETLVLETEFDTPEGTVRIVDCMPIHDDHVDVVRLVEGVRGRVTMETELVIRFDYGSTVPWVRAMDGRLQAIGGPDALVLHTPVALEGREMKHVGEFTVAEGEKVPFVLTWFPSHLPVPPGEDAVSAIFETTSWWREWSARSTYEGKWPEVVSRSAITLKALTYAPTGGMVAAATTSLPEALGGVRNWDYRFCWLRDATMSLYALMTMGYVDEARQWRDWLLRAVAGSPDQFQIMYGPAGERRLTEQEIQWLPGYEGSAPVRIGNAATLQFQLDAYGEVADSLFTSRKMGVPSEPQSWPLYEVVLEFLEACWQQPDEGIWEVRGPRQHFTHSKLMAWVAFDRAVRACYEFDFDWDVARLAALRDQVHGEICAQGFDAEKHAFVQAYGSKALDASLLLMPLVGFLPPEDPRIVGTVQAIERELMRDGFVVRYETERGTDGLPPGEGVFLPCSFWFADNLVLMGRTREATELYERLVSCCNDVGLISEEYDPVAGRMLGNFPQAMTHVALINTACNLSGVPGPAQRRAEGPHHAAGSTTPASHAPRAPGTTS